MTPIEGHLIQDDEPSFQSKNKVVVRGQTCRSEDRSSQEGGDDGNHPATCPFGLDAPPFGAFYF